MTGEPLRTGRDPSVTELMLRRARQIGRMEDSPGSRDQGLTGACQMGSLLASWDVNASLPLLADLTKECRAQNLALPIAKYTEIRADHGDPGALDEYAAWLRTTTPKLLEYGTLQAMQPLVAHPDHAALASAARWLFNDPKSPWVPILPEARGEQSPGFHNLFASPLIVVAGFREGVLAGLADRTPLGTVEKVDNRSIQRKFSSTQSTNYSSSNLELEGVAVGVAYPFRRCDYLASELSALEGSPQIDLFWPETRRDEAVAACVAFLKRYGASFSAVPLAGVQDFPEPRPHLRFPILGKPATPEDVASARAIFSLEGQGETRLASMPGFPQQAKWLTLKDTPQRLD